jgi:hypothetical protein
MTALASDTDPRAVRVTRGSEWSRRFAAGWRRYWFEPMPPERLDVFARIIACTVAFSTFVMDRWAVPHEDAPDSFYRPLQVARLLHLPPPTPVTMTLVQVAIGLCCVWAFTRRAPRAANAALLAAYGTWLLWAFGWSKVDHDKLTIMVVLGVLALSPRLPPVGSASASARALSERWTGWAIRVVQVTFVLAYPFSAYAKIRFGGVGWMGSATFARAIVRRGSLIGDWLVPHPTVLVTAQWAFIMFEVAAVVLLFPRLPKAIRYAALVGVLMLHVMTYAMIGISFLPHTICLTAFLPLERISRGHRAGTDAGRAQALVSSGR